MTIMRTLIVACDAPECADDDGYVTAAHSYSEARTDAARHGWTVHNGRDNGVITGRCVASVAQLDYWAFALGRRWNVTLEQAP